STLTLATAIYIVYIALQVMAEPGLQNLLMARVLPEQRAAASAATLMVMFATHAAVAWFGGRVIVQRGYGTWFVMLSVLGLLAAALFALLFSRASLGETAPASTAHGNYAGPPA